VNSPPHEMEHTSAPSVEQAVQMTVERTLPTEPLAVKASTSSAPVKTTDATPNDAGLLEHVSVLT